MSEETQIKEMAEVLCHSCGNECFKNEDGLTDCYACKARLLYAAGFRKQSEDEVLEALDKFRDLLVNKFIELCNYNDYGRINLLLIGETIDRIYDRCVDDLKGGECDAV